MTRPIVGIINYGTAGNIQSIVQALKKAGAEVQVINSPEEFNGVSKIVLPGVGSFNDGIEELNQRGLTATLIESIQKMPTLGICLGMQILANLGFENGQTQGLSFFPGEVKKMEVDACVPNMGFRKIQVINDSPLLARLDDESFYFMHSYEVINYTHVVALSSYAGHEFISVMQHGQIYGVQFHPEKSREQGIVLFKNFIEL